MADLYPYQKEGVEFLAANKRAYLADEMGLGKTVQAIVAARQVRPSYVCVVCPASVVENWLREWKTWWPDFRGGLNVVSYSKLIRHNGLPINPLPPDSLVILDEAHYCKTPGAKRTKAALRLAARAERSWLLSGTPVPNDVRELWPVFKTLWPEYPDWWNTTTAYKWMDHFTNWAETDYGPRIYSNKLAVKTQLVPALRQVMLRRKLWEVALDLPPLRTTVQYLDRDPALDERIQELAGSDDPEHLSTLRRLLGEYKALPVARVLLDEIEAGNDMVVLYHHKNTGRVVFDILADNTHGPVWGFDGSTPATERQRQIDGFQREGGVFLAQQGAAGIGITLTRASEIVLVEPSWSPSDNDQAIKRIHRIGQDSPCRARIFAVPGSLDEALMLALARKTNMIGEVGL